MSSPLRNLGQKDSEIRIIKSSYFTITGHLEIF